MVTRAESLRAEPCRVVFVETPDAGARGPFEYLLATRAAPLGTGLVAGRLYRLDDGTGIKAPRDAADWIAGRLYRLEAGGDAETILALLDALRGCGPEDVPPFAYERCVQDAVLLDGTVHQAWVYVYQGAVEELARLFPAAEVLGVDPHVDA